MNVLERHWRTLKYVILKRKRKMRLDELMRKLLIELPAFIQEKQGEQPECRVKDKVLKKIMWRAQRGVDLLRDKSNYVEITHDDHEIMHRFRNDECRKKHEVKCRESACGYFVSISNCVAKCTCPDEPLLCKHLHGLMILSGKCYTD
jgi:hypothetical protein